MKILVVEDDLALSAGLCFELDAHDYLSVAAYTCKKALQLLEEGSFDLALLDVNLPDGSGFDLCREIKSRFPGLPVIFLTANDLESDVLSGFDLGAEDYITKPFNMQILLRRVEVALRHLKKTEKPGEIWSDGYLTLNFSALTASCGREDPLDHPQRIQTAAGADRKRRPGPHPPAAARPAVGQRRQLHRRPHPDRHRQPPPGEDRGRVPFLHPDGAGDGLHLDGRETMKQKSLTIASRVLLLLTAALFLALVALLWRSVPWAGVRWGALALCGGICLAALLWAGLQRRQASLFADDLCETLDALIAGREPENYRPYEDSLTARVQGKLLQYYDIMSEGRRQSKRDKQTIQGLVSDISHQVKTPVANLKMFTGILRRHALPPEKQAEFLGTMEGQLDKLDFLMQSLIKMSRLETGTFALHPEEANLADTIARAMSTVWAGAEEKGIELEADCNPDITVRHDPKWTAEALGNILDNAVKYTPAPGRVLVTVRPWQFYTRIDITDTGPGIPEEHYHDVFKRFYRAPETASEEGVGLGLYLANGIVTRQQGYISVRSKMGKGTTFSVYLLS